jgi:hypothetical protein
MIRLKKDEVTCDILGSMEGQEYVVPQKMERLAAARMIFSQERLKVSYKNCRFLCFVL